jgi:hypothetical protein
MILGKFDFRINFLATASALEELWGKVKET